MTLNVTVTADKLQIRQGAGRTFDSLRSLTKDESASVLGIDFTGAWLQLKQPSEQGK